MHEKFDKIFRQARTVVFGAALAGSSLALAASQLTAQQPTDVEGVQAERGTPEIKSDPKADDPPFVGFASLSPEDQERALEGKSFNELWRPGVKLTDEGSIDDARAFLKRALRADYSDEEYLRALNEYLRVANPSSAEDEIKYADIEQTLDEALEIRPNSWRVKAGVAKLLNSLPDVGYMQDGKFVYSYGWRQDTLSCQERRRVRCLQLYADALPLVREELERIGGVGEEESHEARLAKSEARNYYLSFARIFQGGAHEYWRQQTLTDLGALPDYLPVANANREKRWRGAPGDEAGAPVFFAVPESFEAAKNDGERRQALLNEALERFPNSRGEINQIRAIEAQEVFGVQTLAGIPFFSSGDSGAEQESRQEGIWALNTLANNETIAKLASGVKRFKLPPEYDYINLWREVLELNPDDWSALKTLAEEYQNRRQYNKAAKFWERLLDKEKNPENFMEEAQAALSQIVDPRVAIESSSGVAGTKAQIDVRYRNAVGAEIVVKRLNVNEALKIIRSNKFWNDYGDLSSVNNVVAKLQHFKFASKEEIKKLDPKIRKFLDLFDSDDFILEEVARYSVEFEPDPNHFDKVERVELPVAEPGAYFVEIAATDGNKDAAVVWLHDVAVVSKPFEGGRRYFALDAQSGKPLVDQRIDFFFVSSDVDARRELAAIEEYTKQTDKAGSVLLANDEIPTKNSTAVLLVVPKEGGKEGGAKGSGAQSSFMDFHDIRPVVRESALVPSMPSFILFDQPTYRPNQTAEFKFIVGSARSDTLEEPQWAGKEVVYRIVAPNGMTLVQKRAELDAFGAFGDSFEIPADAALGVYSAQIAKDPYLSRAADDWQIVGSFQLREDRKPEFEVIVDAPKEPVALGESFKAKIRARRSYGAPAANAFVSYKVMRVNYCSDYFPARNWDWFYGRGYWQFTYD
jgi:tetratricopeptide (TPR) repeat protein